MLFWFLGLTAPFMLCCSACSSLLDFCFILELKFFIIAIITIWIIHMRHNVGSTLARLSHREQMAETGNNWSKSWASAFGGGGDSSILVWQLCCKQKAEAQRPELIFFFISLLCISSAWLSVCVGVRYGWHPTTNMNSQADNEMCLEPSLWCEHSICDDVFMPVFTVYVWGLIWVSTWKPNGCSVIRAHRTALSLI